MKKESIDINDFKLKIVKDLVTLQNQVGYKSEDIDEEILHDVCDSNYKELKVLRNNLWLEYTRLILENIDTLILELLKNFVEIQEIKSIHSDFKELEKKYEDLSDSSNFEEIKKLFNAGLDLSNKIRGDEKILKKQGSDRYKLKIFPTYFSLISVVYWGLATHFNLINHLMTGILAWLIVVLIAHYCIKWWFRKGL